MKHIHAGKVRDLYELDGDIILVASDRVSVYDVTLPTAIPDKGALLTQLSAWWFRSSATSSRTTSSRPPTSPRSSAGTRCAASRWR
ncbi:hypothetical protein GCM10020366_03450 [Saccharopolyspora gregorii]|uniref:phosphoribosylaminoimidazolesuccinocarboxamide synthase n=1 Tax=Saccharopolyspora gregorii TaxID=33914 RepID=A0ABP6RGJ8_9PSEU